MVSANRMLISTPSFSAVPGSIPGFPQSPLLLLGACDLWIPDAGFRLDISLWFYRSHV